jgi:hypothetical protein
MRQLPGASKSHFPSVAFPGETYINAAHLHLPAEMVWAAKLRQSAHFVKEDKSTRVFIKPLPEHKEIPEMALAWGMNQYFQNRNVGNWVSQYFSKFIPMEPDRSLEEYIDQKRGQWYARFPYGTVAKITLSPLLLSQFPSTVEVVSLFFDPGIGNPRVSPEADYDTDPYVAPGLDMARLDRDKLVKEELERAKERQVYHGFTKQSLHMLSQMNMTVVELPLAYSTLFIRTPEGVWEVWWQSLADLVREKLSFYFVSLLTNMEVRSLLPKSEEAEHADVVHAEQHVAAAVDEAAEHAKLEASTSADAEDVGEDIEETSNQIQLAADTAFAALSPKKSAK